MGRRPGRGERRGPGGAGRAQPHRRQGRARVHLRACRRSRPTRSTSASTTATRRGTTCTGRDLDRQARAAAQEHRQDRRLGLRPRRRAAARRARDRQGRHGGPAGRRPTASRPSTPARVFESCGPEPLPQGRQARLHARRTRATSTSCGSCSSTRDRRRGAGRVGPAEARRLRRGDLLRGDATSWSATSYEDERQRVYFRDKAWEADYKLLQAKFPGKEHRLRRPRPPTTRGLADHRGERHRPRRALHLRPQDEDADAPVQGPRAHPARAHGADEGDPLPVLGRPRDPRLPDAAQGRRREGPADDRRAARRPVGPRQLGLQQPRAVPREPRLRGAAAQLPRARPATARSS